MIRLLISMLGVLAFIGGLRALGLLLIGVVVYDALIGGGKVGFEYVKEQPCDGCGMEIPEDELEESEEEEGLYCPDCREFA